MPARPPPFPRRRRGKRCRRMPEIYTRQRSHEAGSMRVSSAGLERGGVEQLLRSGEETGAECEMPVRCDAVEHGEDGWDQSSDRHHYS